MKKIFIAVLVLFIAACTKVPAGNVGIKVNLLGSDKGVDVQEMSPGRYWLSVNEEMYLFPTFSQTDTWQGVQALSFQTIEGMTVIGDVGITYNIVPDKASLIFQKFRKELQEISDSYIRNMVRDALVKVAGNKQIETVYGSGKTELIAEVEKAVRDQVAPMGINVERIYWVGDLKLPQTVVQSINAKIAATQQAQQRENEIQTAKAEAQKKIEEARGEAESRLEIAKAEAQAIEVKGNTLRNNPQLLELSAIEKWNGVLPQVSSDSTPFVKLK